MERRVGTGDGGGSDVPKAGGASKGDADLYTAKVVGGFGDEHGVRAGIGSKLLLLHCTRSASSVGSASRWMTRQTALPNRPSRRPDAVADGQVAETPIDLLTTRKMAGQRLAAWTPTGWLSSQRCSTGRPTISQTTSSFGLSVWQMRTATRQESEWGASWLPSTAEAACPGPSSAS